jgi:multiple sugar transport system ATP-binding protein
VALGRAIVRDAQVFLMDEPLSNLDAQLRVQTRAELVRLHERLQATIIYVTHDQVEAMTMGDRLAVLNAGVLQQLDTPQGVYDRPANLFVARFIGSPAMNVLPGRLETRDGTMGVVAAGEHVALSAAQAAAVQALEGDQVLVGIRPEHLVLDGSAAANGSLAGQVDVVERLGNELLVYVAVPGVTLSTRLPADAAVARGDTVRLAVRADRLHLVDPRSERALASV